MMDPTNIDPIHAIISDALAQISGLNLFYQQRPQKSPLPAAVYNLPTSDHEYDDEGPVGLAFYRINFETWATTFEECKRVHSLVRERMRVIGGDFEPTGENDNQPDPREPDAKNFNLNMDFELWINYPVPGA